MKGGCIEVCVRLLKARWPPVNVVLLPSLSALRHDGRSLRRTGQSTTAVLPHGITPWWMHGTVSKTPRHVRWRAWQASSVRTVP
eukprot:5408010-Ditylum_brightwellii.AAC.1